MPKDTVEKPNDLITAKEASIMANKSKATIRAWVRKGKISGYKSDDNNHSSPLLVSTDELKLYLAINGTITPPKVGRPSTPSVSVVEKDKEIERLEKQLEITERELSMNTQRVEDLKAFITTLENQLKSRDGDIVGLREQLQRVLDLQGKTQDDYNTLLHWVSMPWWKKWNKDIKLLNG